MKMELRASEAGMLPASLCFFLPRGFLKAKQFLVVEGEWQIRGIRLILWNIPYTYTAGTKRWSVHKQKQEGLTESS